MATVKYANLIERATRVKEQEALGLTMLHDDFDPDWKRGQEPHGTLVFDAPTPESAASIAERTEAEVMKVNIAAIDSIGNLADAKVFLKKVCARLVKKGLLP